MPYNPTDQISVYSRPRPVRIAFIVDVNNCPVEMQKAILDFNSIFWGGRLNPIIPIDKGIIPSGYWNLMNFYDPDIIYSYSSLPGDLVKQIDTEVSPFHFIIHKAIREDSYKFAPNMHGEFSRADFSVMPKGIPNPFREKYSFLICQNRHDWEHYLFFQTNFGIYNDLNMYHPPSELERLEIVENSTPDIFLEQITNQRRGILCPWQFTVADVPVRQFDIKGAYRHDCFTVVVGDSIWNWLYMWNKVFLLSDWKRKEINQFYMPCNILEKDDALPFIKKFISTHAYRNGSSPPTVLFVSSDIDNTKLSEIGKKLTEKIDAIPQAKSINFDFDELNNLNDPVWFYPPKYIQHDYVSSKKFYLKFPKPFSDGKPQRGEWAVDLMIEYHPQKFSYTNISYWWKLPRVHSLSRCFFENWSGKGRINGDGQITAIVGSDRNPDLCLHIPDERNIFHMLLTRDQQPHFTDDIRYNPKPTKPVYDFIQLSDKGRYLNGFLGLVGSLFNAGALIENHFWRTVFEYMSGVNNQNENSISGALSKKLNTWMPGWFQNVPADPIKKQQYFSRIENIISTLTIRFGRRMKTPTLDINFCKLLELFDLERQGFIKMPQHANGFETTSEKNREDLLEAIENLTTLRILIQGIKPSCPRCGFDTWYPVNEVKFELICQGCQFEMQIPPEVEWVYRLNSLVVDVIRNHGTFPVVWTLSNILQSSRESFIFRPCLELLENYEGRILTELDLACISDGKFIIGEIKTNANQFSSSDVKKLCDVAKNVLPQQIVIGAFDPPYDKLKDVAKEIAENLRGLNIEVQIKCPSKQLNEPEYHPYF